jgi:error-prone DNA polymerase
MDVVFKSAIRDPQSAMPYTELHTHSAYSFGDGVLTPEALAARAAALGYEALALTDTAELGGVVRFAMEAQRRGLRPIAGAELYVDGHAVVLLVRDETGFRNLAGLVTRARLASARGRPRLSLGELAARAEGLHLLSGPGGGQPGALLRAGRREEAHALLGRWARLFPGRLAVQVELHHVGGAEAALAAALVALAREAAVPWVVTNGARYLDDAGRRVHDLQTALRAGLDVDAASRTGLLLPNGEWRLKSPDEMQTLWQGGTEGLEQSRQIAAECGFSLQWLRPPLPRFPVHGSHDEWSFLREQVYAGASERWGRVGERERRQLEHELGVIRRLGFAGFFLVMWKAVRFARGRGILCQGRGSAANSVVAFCLGITAVDPVKHELLFERFLSEARTDGLTEAPDIDVDFEAHRREEVLNYIYESYDREHAAITAVTQVYSAPSALQDVMRALGYPAGQALEISKRLHRYDPEDGADAVAKELGPRFGIDTAAGRGRALVAAMRVLEGVPRMRSTHPGGFVLSGAPLGDYLPIERTSMGRTILQFDKDDLDTLGVPKFDFLGLGGLTAIRIAFDAVERGTGTRLDLYNLPQEDEATYRMIARGDTLGTFQIESRAQIQSLLQTRPETLYDLVVQVALIRPGPIQARFVHPYTRRRRGLEQVEYAHPALKPILERTQGIPIFQEQAMSISMTLGGFTAAEADELRRAMGHVRKAKRLMGVLERLEQRMAANGVNPGVAHRVVEDFRTFANYGFPESHAWSFALIAYATAYLKARYPAEFLLGLLNAWPMGFYSPATLVHDAMRHGVEVRPPCLAHGGWESTLEERGTGNEEREGSAHSSLLAPRSSPAVRVGWRHIRGLGKRAREALQAARLAAPFTSVEDVVRRAGLARAETLQLARAGAFEAWEPGRRRAAWEALRVVGDSLPLAPARHLPFDPAELDGDELVFLDYLATGISTHGHPMRQLRGRLDAAGVARSRDLEAADHGARILVAGLVVARQHPSTSRGTVFVLLEDEWGFINIIVPPRMYADHRETVRYSPFLLVEGRFERDGDVINVVGRRFRRLRASTLSYRSHDFH